MKKPCAFCAKEIPQTSTRCVFCGRLQPNEASGPKTPAPQPGPGAPAVSPFAVLNAGVGSSQPAFQLAEHLNEGEPQAGTLLGLKSVRSSTKGINHTTLPMTPVVRRPTSGDSQPPAPAPSVPSSFSTSGEGSTFPLTPAVPRQGPPSGSTVSTLPLTPAVQRPPKAESAPAAEPANKVLASRASGAYPLQTPAAPKSGPIPVMPSGKQGSGLLPLPRRVSGAYPMFTGEGRDSSRATPLPLPPAEGVGTDPERPALKEELFDDGADTVSPDEEPAEEFLPHQTLLDPRDLPSGTPPAVKKARAAAQEAIQHVEAARAAAKSAIEAAEAALSAPKAEPARGAPAPALDSVDTALGYRSPAGPRPAPSNKLLSAPNLPNSEAPAAPTTAERQRPEWAWRSTVAPTEDAPAPPPATVPPAPVAAPPVVVAPPVVAAPPVVPLDAPVTSPEMGSNTAQLVRSARSAPEEAAAKLPGARLSRWLGVLAGALLVIAGLLPVGPDPYRMGWEVALGGGPGVLLGVWMIGGLAAMAAGIAPAKPVTRAAFYVAVATPLLAVAAKLGIPLLAELLGPALQASAKGVAPAVRGASTAKLSSTAELYQGLSETAPAWRVGLLMLGWTLLPTALLYRRADTASRAARGLVVAGSLAVLANYLVPVEGRLISALLTPITGSAEATARAIDQGSFSGGSLVWQLLTGGDAISSFFGVLLGLPLLVALFSFTAFLPGEQRKTLPDGSVQQQTPPLAKGLAGVWGLLFSLYLPVPLLFLGSFLCLDPITTPTGLILMRGGMAVAAAPLLFALGASQILTQLTYRR